MSPIVNRLENEFAGEITVQRLDVNQPENAEIQQAYNLRGHPTFAVLNGSGEVVNRYFGVVDEIVLRQDMQAIAP